MNRNLTKPLIPVPNFEEADAEITQRLLQSVADKEDGRHVATSLEDELRVFVE